MDILNRLMKEHGEISEKAVFFREALAVIKKDKGHDQINAFAVFLNEFVAAHFEYEELEIFPKLLERGRPEDVDLVRSLQADHVRILALVEGFFNGLDEMMREPDHRLIESLSSKAMEIITLTLRHAEIEDGRLIPLINIHFPGKMTPNSP